MKFFPDYLCIIEDDEKVKVESREILWREGHQQAQEAGKGIKKSKETNENKNARMEYNKIIHEQEKQSMKNETRINNGD